MKSIAIAVGIWAVGYFLLFLLHRPGKTPVSADFNFHPDSVHEFSWSLKGQTFAFKRESRSKPWEPAVDSNNLQVKLNALGNLQLTEMSAPKSGLEIVIGFGGENKWSGIYDSEHFVWNEGLHKGKGFKADEDVAHIFEEGALAFEKHQWEWCEKRPVKISVKTDYVKYELTQKNRAWVLKKDGKESTLDATMVEKWLGKNCLVKVDFFRDLVNFPIGLKLADGYFNVEFEGGVKKDRDWKASFFLVDKDRGASSASFVKALEDLILIPGQ